MLTIIVDFTLSGESKAFLIKDEKNPQPKLRVFIT